MRSVCLVDRSSIAMQRNSRATSCTDSVGSRAVHAVRRRVARGHDLRNKHGLQRIDCIERAHLLDDPPDEAMAKGDGRIGRRWRQGAQQADELIVAEAKVRHRAQCGAVGEFEG
jgi:hypothetical protein